MTTIHAWFSIEAASRFGSAVDRKGKFARTGSTWVK